MLSLDALGNVTAHSMRRICCALVPKQARGNLICSEHGAVYGQVIILPRPLRKGSAPYSRDGSLEAVELLLAFGLENAFGKGYEEAHQACTAFKKGMAKLPRQKRYKPSLCLRFSIVPILPITGPHRLLEHNVLPACPQRLQVMFQL